MRAVSLSNKDVQKKVAELFVPLKVAIRPGTKQFPLDWAAMKGWDAAYRRMGAEKCEGITACSVVTPDLKWEYGNTGSAFVWELFDSIAYDAKKFEAMLDRAQSRWKRAQSILGDKTLSKEVRDRKLLKLGREVSLALALEGRFHLPPKGFTIEGAMELFRMTGDLKDKK